MKDFRTHLYRLQQRLAISRGESIVVIALFGLFALGLVAQHFQQGRQPVDESAYTTTDRRFQERIKTLPGPNRPGRPASDDDQAAETPAEQPSQFVLDLNAATPAELEQLPGIGPVLSARIEQYRLQHGPFQRIEEITRVQGIGEKTLDDLKPMLVVNAMPTQKQR